MATQDHPANRGREHGRRAADELRRQLRDGRHDRALSLRDVGRAVGLSASEVGRIERGLVPLDVVRASTLLAVVGLELSVRAYPTGQPIRDRAHARCSTAFGRDFTLASPGEPRCRCPSRATFGRGMR